MCGVAGILSLGPIPPGESALLAMQESLQHRGPDEAGATNGDDVGLAIRRLNIIGIQNGSQPIFNEDRSVAVVMNGEIYNYRPFKTDLQRRGHVFSTDSDAEVIVHLYEEMGLDLVDKLRGMFAFALFDHKTGTLALARDRIGKKPLYYSSTNDFLVFASEIKAIHASGLVSKTIDPDAIAGYLAYGFVPGEGTMFRHVRKLPPGCLLIANRQGRDLRPYWDFPVPEGRPLTFDAASHRLRELIEEAVELRLMSEVPLGAFLSGGIDSGTVVALMARQLGRPVHTFCVGFEDASLDELDYARAVSRHLGTVHHDVVVKGCSQELLERINYHNDEPASDPAALPTYCVSEFAREHITVALTGEGGDEIFAGYPHYEHARRLDLLLKRLPPLAPLARLGSRFEPLLRHRLGPRLMKAMWLASLQRSERERGWTSAFTQRELESMTGQAAAISSASQLTRALDLGRNGLANRDALSRLLYVDSKLGLAELLLMKVDKMSMAASLEARCPLLDQELVEFASTLPHEMKLSRHGSKRILRHAVRDLLPPDIVARPKHGFDVPIRRWLLGELAPLVERLVLAEHSPLAPYAAPAALQGMWRRMARRTDSRLASQVWRALNFAIWHELHWPQFGLASQNKVHSVAWAGGSGLPVDESTAPIAKLGSQPVAGSDGGRLPS